jgi:hypothetical protein
MSPTSPGLIHLDDHRPVWRVVKGKCRACGAEAVSTQHKECPADDTECPKCPANQWCVTHYEVSGAFVPRLEAVAS